MTREAEPAGDGIFDDDEREHYLTLAVAAIKARHDKVKSEAGA